MLIRNDRTGETKVMRNGLRATIIKYKNNRNMSIKFENGVIVDNVSYINFRTGEVKCPMIYNIKGDYVECVNPNTGLVFLIDEEDLEKIRGGFWHTGGNKHYVISNIKGRLHRLVMGCKDDVFIDHISGNVLDNRKRNLRICTNTENSWNKGKYKTNKSGYKGVSWQKNRNKWQASITKNRKQIHLGFYSTKEEAYEAYCKAAMELHGEFAKTA